MTNFTPGAGVFLNEWFLLPLWSSAILFTLASSRASLFPRCLADLLALAVASLGLPTYPQVLTAYATPDYRLQFFITLAVFALIALMVIAGPRWAHLHPYFALGCAVACCVTLTGLFVVKAPIEQLYGSVIAVGAGWWITLSGVVLLFASASVKILRRFARKYVD